MAETPQKAFETLKSNVMNAVSSYFPFKGRFQTVVLDKVWVDDHLSSDDIKDQQDAKNYERTWGVPIKATLRLLDNQTGKVVDKSTKTLAVLPKLTSRYGFIVNGNEYQVDHLLRLKSGVYTRVQENGDLESEFNLLKSPTKGGFSLHLDRESKLFTLKAKDSHIPLYPILKTMGVSDDTLEQQWGKEIFEANKPKNQKKFDKSLVGFHKSLGDKDAPPPATMEEFAKHVWDWFDQTKLREDTTKLTLGKSFDKVTGEALQVATKKLLDVSRGVQKADDRDSLAYKDIVSVEDFIPEKIERSAAKVRARLRSTVDHKKSITEIVNSKLFHEPIQEFFSKGGSIAERQEQTNPLLMLGGHRKTTLMSEKFGGIKSDFSLTEGMRLINPTSMGFLDPMHTPESERTGITLHLAQGVRKNGKDLEAPIYDMKAGKLAYMKVSDYHNTVAVLPDQVRWHNGKPVPISDNVKVKLPDGSIDIRPFKDATHIVPSAKAAFDEASNLIPFLPSDQGNRVSMACKQMEQAISVKHREAPLVQTKTDARDPGLTFEKHLGNFVVTHAPMDGKVVAVKDDHIVLDDGKKKHTVQLYDYFPLNDPKGMMHSHPTVKVGDSVKQGQLLADTNYTKGGALALGTNLRVGYIPYKGYNYDDGVVISESAAKKFTSEHLHRPVLEVDPDHDIVDKEKWRRYATAKANSLTKEQLDALDDTGVIRVGTKITKGQVLVAALGKPLETKASGALRAAGNRAIKPYKDKSLTWEEDHAGEVVRVIRDPSGKGVKVFVKTEEPMQVGDKLAGRHGNKGIVTMILPDHEMPFTVDAKSGEKKPLEVLLNPLGVPSRINTGQMLETTAAKIAEKTGKPYIVDNFAGEGHDYLKQVKEDLKKHGIQDEEMVYDPDDPRRPLGSVTVGPQYLLKLRHQVEKKLSVRGAGTDLNRHPLAYDKDRQPGKGGEGSGQGFGALDMYTLLGHNARHNVREMATFKSDQQEMDTFWRLVQEGHEPPPPQVPFVYQKFEALMKAAGLNLKKEGTKVRLYPMTDKEIVGLAGGPKGEIKSPHLALYSKTLKPEEGGLYDTAATGGLDGSKWSYIRMAEPMPNPMFVGQNQRPGPIPVLLGLSIKAVDSLMQGKETLHGKTGGAALEEALKKIDVDKELSSIKEKLSTLKGDDLDRANRKFKYLQALKESGLKPHEAYIMRVLPVIPPKFRPVTATHTGDISYAPLNGLYKNFGTVNNKLKEFDPTIFSNQHANPMRTQLWDALKAIQSVGKYKNVYDTDSHGQRVLKGILDTIGGGEGEQPKQGFFQAKLVKHRQDLSIRSTIVPEPKLGLDQVGLPRDAAMELYKPFVVAQMHKWGIDPLRGQDEARKGTDVAWRALEEVVKDRPIILKRDPALHKFNVMAFQPVLVQGKAIQIHPLVTGGFNADFDGDTMAGTVPVSAEAVAEAKKMYPSRNLFSPTHFGVMYKPEQESLLGLHLISKWGKKVNKTFANPLEADKAASRGEISRTDVVRIGGKETTLGRYQIADRLPADFVNRDKILHDPAFEVAKGTIGSVIVEPLAKNHAKDFSTHVDRLKNLGNEAAYKSGFSFGLKDLEPLKGRDEILHEADKRVAHIRKTVSDKKEADRQVVEAYQDATDKMVAKAKEQAQATGNRLATMVFSGSKGKVDQWRQMIAAPMLMMDASSKVIPIPVRHSYAEGLDFGEYWMTQHGARKGTIQRAQGTSEPGVISKDLVNMTMDTLVHSDDCGVKSGILLPLGHKDLVDRFTAVDYKLRDGGTVAAGTVVTPEVINRLKNSKIEKVMVRSPLKCQHGNGICAKCFGVSESGKTHDVGTNIGILAGQALSEPVVQMAMDSFHTGGVATGRGAQSVDRFTMLRNLLHMPRQLKNEATVAKATGEVTSIKADPTGGYNVFVGSERHLVPAHLALDVKVGDKVEAGQQLSSGITNPHHFLAATKDVDKLQRHLVSELNDKIYAKEGVRQRNIEVVVRSLTNVAKITNPGNHPHWVHGDVAPRSAIEAYNRSLAKGEKPIEHEPLLPGIEQVTLTGSQDWLARLNYRYIHQTVQQAAQMGWTSDLHGTHPIPALAYGKEFGRPTADKPKHNY